MVKVTEEAGKGWYEITNGLTGVRIPTGQGFVDETAGLDAATIASAGESWWQLGAGERRLASSPPIPRRCRACSSATDAGPPTARTCCTPRRRLRHEGGIPRARPVRNRGQAELLVQGEARHPPQPAVSRSQSRLSRRRRALHLHDHGDGGSAVDPVRGGFRRRDLVADEPAAGVEVRHGPPPGAAEGRPDQGRRLDRPLRRRLRDQLPDAGEGHHPSDAVGATTWRVLLAAVRFAGRRASPVVGVFADKVR